MEATTSTPARVNLAGFIATEPQIRSFATSSVVRFALSVRVSAESKETKLESVEMWVKNDNLATAQTLMKGQRVAVFGAYKTQAWTDKDGQEHSRVVLNAFSVKNAPLKAQDAA